MDFCPKCGAVLVSKRYEDKKEGEKIFLVCRKCGMVKKKYKAIEIKEDVIENPQDQVIIVKKNAEALPKTVVNCPKCENNEAYWWTQEIEVSDEDSVIATFFKCTKCAHKWREY